MSLYKNYYLQTLIFASYRVTIVATALTSFFKEVRLGESQWTLCIMHYGGCSQA